MVLQRSSSGGALASSREACSPRKHQSGSEYGLMPYVKLGTAMDVLPAVAVAVWVSGVRFGVPVVSIRALQLP